MAHLNRRRSAQIAVAVFSMIALYAGGGLVAAGATPPSTSGSGDFPLQPQCGPDPVTLIDPCESLPQSGAAADSAPQIPWDVIDSVLFG